MAKLSFIYFIQLNQIIIKIFSVSEFSEFSFYQKD